MANSRISSPIITLDKSLKEQKQVDKSPWKLGAFIYKQSQKGGWGLSGPLLKHRIRFFFYFYNRSLTSLTIQAHKHVLGSALRRRGEWVSSALFIALAGRRIYQGLGDLPLWNFKYYLLRYKSGIYRGNLPRGASLRPQNTPGGPGGCRRPVWWADNWLISEQSARILLGAVRWKKKTAIKTEGLVCFARREWYKTWESGALPNGWPRWIKHGAAG